MPRLTLFKTIAVAAAAALVITAVGQGVWGALAFANLALSPAAPWAPVVMVGVLALLFGVLTGRIGPHKGAEERRALVSLQAVSGPAWTWSLIAGAFGIAAVAGLWITLGQLVQTAPNVLPRADTVPLWTMLAFLAMSIIAAPLTEELAFRGYAMGLLRRVMPPAAALVVSSVMFALVHLSQGLYPTKLLAYFLAGLMLGFTAWRTGSLIPAMVVHAAGDLFFFTLVWPNDQQRAHVRLSAAGEVFWLQCALTLALGALAVFAYGRLAQLTAARPLRASGPAYAV